MLNDEMYKEVAEYWGDRMPMMAMEEMAELIKAISKFERLDFAEETNEMIKSGWLNVIDEIGDVFISCKALMSRYGIPQERVDKRINDKLNKKY